VTYGGGQIARLASIIILTRLLSPELFGIMLIVNSVRTGIDLLSDVGVTQTIVQNKNAENPDFYNTAWTLKSIRGLFIWIFCAVAASAIAHFYNSPILRSVFPVAALYFVLDGFTSVSLSLMQKRMQVIALNLLGFLNELIPGILLVVLAYFYRSIWSLIIGLLIAQAVRMVISFFVLNDVRVKFHISKQYLREIIQFGRWIFLSSAIYFLSGNFDRLYLGKVAPLGLVGVYGITRSMSDMIDTLVGRLCGYIVFPYISSSSEKPKDLLHREIGSVRLQLLFLSAISIGAFAAVADLPVKFIFDQRYHAAAGWLPITTLGVWFSILCNMNEAFLLGFGKPQYAALGNAAKLGWLVVALPFAYTSFGFYGVVLAIAASNFFRCIPLGFGQIRTRFSFLTQDASLTCIMFLIFGSLVWLRWHFGFGVAFEKTNG
jgi:O-antigen/teichoic acid export membrane protein